MAKNRELAGTLAHLLQNERYADGYALFDAVQQRQARERRATRTHARSIEGQKPAMVA